MNTIRLITPFALLAALWASAPAAAQEQPARPDRIVAIGDIHGDHEGLVALLRETSLVGEDGRWTGGRARLVIVGDAVDRGTGSRRVLDLLMRLEGEARASGGEVHVLLGNHEAMWLTGDHEYTTRSDYAAFAQEESPDMREAARKRYNKLTGNNGSQSDFDQHFPPGALAMREAMSPRGRYGRWLMERPVAVVLGDTAFVHAGISETYAGRSADRLNEQARVEIHDLMAAWDTLARAGVVAREYPLLDAARALKAHADVFEDYPREVRVAVETVTGAFDAMVFDPDGPLWYRGSAACHPLVESGVLSRALDGLGAASLVVSHTPVAHGQISQRLGGRLVRIDTGERAAALVITGDGREAVYASGGWQPLLDDSAHHPIARVPMSADEIERFLAEAKIVHVEAVGTGVTNPQRVTLEHDGVRLRAIFKSEATPQRSTNRLSSRRLTNIADRHAYELAAYRLDRLLGLNMVPPAVERRIGRETGTLQLWVENAMNERSRRKQDIEPEPMCPLAKDYALLELFDRLIYNTDRTQENILYLPDWRVALIDHTRAFRTHTGKPEAVRHVRPSEAPEFARRLAALDRDTLHRELGELLDRQQLSALLARKDEIVAEWRESSGELLADR